MSTVNATQLVPAIEACIDSGLSVITLGSPGGGKTEISQQVFDRIDRWVSLWDLSSKQPVDVNGPPVIEIVDGIRQSTFATPKFFHDLNRRAEAEGPGVLFLDEVTSGDLPTQRTTFPLWNHGALPDGFQLDPRIAVVGTGNLPTDGTGVRALPTAITTGRVAQFELEFDAAAWKRWAVAAGIDHRFVGLGDWRPALLNQFDGSVRGPQATPRSWVRYSKIAEQLTPVGVEHSAAAIETRRVCGEALVGQGAAAEAEHFLKVAANLPKRDSILRHPDTARVPEVSTEVDVLYALCCSLSHFVSIETADPIFQYISRLPSEFQQLFVSDAIVRHTDLKADSAYSAWVRSNSDNS